MAYFGLLLVLLLLGPSLEFAWRTWKKGGDRLSAAGVALYSALALLLAIYQFFLR